MVSCKVTTKNAFDFELIEHMGEILSCLDVTQMETNFHHAAGTMDAATRISGAKVDSVHLDASLRHFRMPTSWWFSVF